MSFLLKKETKEMTIKCYKWVFANNQRVFYYTFADTPEDVIKENCRRYGIKPVEIILLEEQLRDEESTELILPRPIQVNEFAMESSPLCRKTSGSRKKS